MSRSASTTARWPTSPRSSRSSARSRPKRSPGCWAFTSSGWPPSPTATVSARPISRVPPARLTSRVPQARPKCRTVHFHSEGIDMTQISDPTTAPVVTGQTPGGFAGAGQTQDQHLQALGNYEWGWSDSDVAGATAQRGLTPEIVANISGAEERAAVDARPAAEGPQAVRPQADADLGRGARTTSTSTTSSTSSAPRRSRPRPGTTCRPTSRTPTTSSASRRRRRRAWFPASPPSTSPRWSTTRSTRSSRSRA